jgi:hypothetical protein
MKDVIKHVVIGVSDEVFAADAIDKTAGKIQVYFQRKIEGAKKNALRGRGIIEEECDRYRDIFAGEKGNEEIEPLLKISPAKGNYFADHISVPPSKREVVQSRNSNDYIEWGRDLVNGAEYYMNRLAWSQEGLRQFLLTRIIPGEKRDSGRYSLGSFIEDIVDRVNVFDDYIDIIFLPVDECAESNGKPGLAREWRKRMPLANPV